MCITYDATLHTTTRNPAKPSKLGACRENTTLLTRRQVENTYDAFVMIYVNIMIYDIVPAAAVPLPLYARLRSLIRRLQCPRVIITRKCKRSRSGPG